MRAIGWLPARIARIEAVEVADAAGAVESEGRLLVGARDDQERPLRRTERRLQTLRRQPAAGLVAVYAAEHHDDLARPPAAVDV